MRSETVAEKIRKKLLLKVIIAANVGITYISRPRLQTTMDTKAPQALTKADSE